ncbi:MAG: ATP-binding cassette domain-containing protein [Deltaproteobacteria bacterium]|nr:ATP-binding cassette domain-containing protein [Deltaproteobacteria bacterium]
MRPYLRLLKYLSPYWHTIVIAFVCMAAFAVTNGAMAYLIGPVLKFLFSTDGQAEVRIIPLDLFTIPKEKMIVAVPLMIMAVAVIKGLSSFGQTYFMGYSGQRVVTDVRERLYGHILDFPVGYFARTPTGALVSSITNDINLLQGVTTDTMTKLFKHSLSMIVLVIIVVSMDWRLAIAASVAFPLAIYPMIRFGQKMKKISTKGQVSMSVMTTLLSEAIGAIRIVKAFCMEAYERARFRDENERYTRYQRRNLSIRSISSPLMETFGAVGFAATIWYAAYRINAGTLTPEAFISFFAALLMLYQPIKALNGVNLNLQQGAAAAGRVFDLMDLPGETGLRQGGKELHAVGEAIEFKSVSFAYVDKPVLSDVSLKIKKGERIAIVGLSGAGKTTLVNLIPRFYDVTTGAILIDGSDIRGFTLKSLRDQIAIVSQQVVLFNDTVKNNISYGSISRTEDDIIKAAVAANAHGFISRLLEGYSTLIGEGGVRLSGGERQRVSIARAILKNAPVLIMDEATSSLDTESEMEVEKGLKNLFEGRTTFVIAHRLSTVRNVDRIIVLSHGRIKEIGTHDELIRLGGEYSRLYTMQFYGTDEAVTA